jgi:integrase
LASGKWRARYRGPDGKRRGQIFTTKADARAWLATQHADLTRRLWKAPEAARRTVGNYAADYLVRTDLRASTRALYSDLWRLHLESFWAEIPIGDVTPAHVRTWHTAAAKRSGPTVVAQAYRLLRSLFNVAVADEVIPSNPCRLRGAATPRPARAARALTVVEVMALVDAIPDRFSALVLLLAFGGLRFGEATALRRSDVAQDRSEVRIERSVRTGRVGPPKTDAGRRIVALPQFVAEALAAHMDRYTPRANDALVFGTATGNFLARQNFSATFKRAVERCDLPAVRVHELRHTGATLAAQAGATTKELMSRLGHSSSAAALNYQHASQGRDRELARALDALMPRP